MTAIASPRSPRAIARLTGVLYLCIMVAAMFAEGFVRDRLIVSGNAAATAHNIVTSEALWRGGVAADIFTTVCDVAVAALLYILLRPVSRTASFTAAFFRLAYSAAMAARAALLIAPLFLLADAAGGSAPAVAQAQSLTAYSLRLHAAGFEVGLVLFGVHLLIVGGMIARSTFLPRLLGAMLAIAGVCYIANSLIGIVAPPLSHGLFPWILLPGFLAEGALTLWLIVVGVNPQRWLAASGEVGT